MSAVTVLSPNGILGYGFPEASLEHGLKERPDVIGTDGGSTDQGPGDLGRGTGHVSRDACYRDIELLLVGARKLGIPLLIGTAGGAGAEAHVQETRDQLLEAARKNNLHFKLAVISSDVDKDYLHKKIDDNGTKPLDGASDLTHELVDETGQIVGVMGAEPYMEALKQGADVVLAGRSSDTAIFAAVPLLKGKDPGPVWHAGKILECGAAAAEPMAATECMLAWTDDGAFEVAPAHPDLRCTPLSVAAHTLYENPSPYLITEPAGTIDTRQSNYEAVSDRRVRVSGSQFIPADRYSIKLEGAKLVGYRTIALGITRDPLLIATADKYFDAVARDVERRVRETYGDPPPKYQLHVRQIGRNGAMGALEPIQEVTTHELGLLISVVAESQRLADAILAIARTHAIHGLLEGRSGVQSNLAFPFAPSDISVGETYAFTLNHVVYPDNPLELFPIKMETV
jgi:hypothetical protein